MVLDQFGIPEDFQGGHRSEVLSRRLRKTPDEALASLWRFLTGTDPPAPRSTLAGSSTADLKRLWGEGSPRVFLSHRADHKVFAKGLKDELEMVGAAAFVAHEDIEPTRAWQREIERALAMMDLVASLHTTGFATSWWTNQEIGVALGRGVPILCVRVDEDPQGFVGSSQAIAGVGRPAADIAKALISAMSAYAQLARPLQMGAVKQWETSRSFDEAIRAFKLIDTFKTMPTDLLARIERAYETNAQLYRCAAVGRRYPAFVARIKGLETPES